MKYYKLYMDRQEISRRSHENLVALAGSRRHTRPVWIRYGTLAACAVLLIGAGMWAFLVSPMLKPAPEGNPFIIDSASSTAGRPAQADDAQNASDCRGFVVSSPDSELMLPMVPAIFYPDITDRPEAAADRAYAPGSFTVDLDWEDIQSIFCGASGQPEAGLSASEHLELPWMLFWGGYTVSGHAMYDGQGQLMELTILGEKDLSGFTLELRLGALPFTCCIDLDRGDQSSDVFGTKVAGWSKVYDRDGDGLDDYLCGSEFMTQNSIGVRFQNRGNSLEDASLFNSLFVRQALAEDGGLYLDHLETAGSVPVWREDEFSTLAQAREEIDFALYLPAREPAGFRAAEFYGRLSYQEGHKNMLFARWSQGYDEVDVCVYRDGYHPCNLVDVGRPESYDLRLYPIPWSSSVPPEYRETVSRPAFRAEDMSLSVVEARGRAHDTGGLTYSFEVLHPDGTLVSYHCDGMSAQQVWDMVDETL